MQSAGSGHKQSWRGNRGAARHVDRIPWRGAAPPVPRTAESSGIHTGPGPPPGCPNPGRGRPGPRRARRPRTWGTCRGAAGPAGRGPRGTPQSAVGRHPKTSGRGTHPKLSRRKPRSAPGRRVPAPGQHLCEAAPLRGTAACLLEPVKEAAALALRLGDGGSLQESVPGEGVEVAPHAAQKAALRSTRRAGFPVDGPGG